MICILSLYFIPTQCVKRGPPPPPPEKFKIMLDPNDYYQSDEPHTDVPQMEEHNTEPNVHGVSAHFSIIYFL